LDRETALESILWHETEMTDMVRMRELFEADHWQEGIEWCEMLINWHQHLISLYRKDLSNAAN